MANWEYVEQVGDGVMFYFEVLTSFFTILYFYPASWSIEMCSHDLKTRTVSIKNDTGTSNPDVSLLAFDLDWPSISNKTYR